MRDVDLVSEMDRNAGGGAIFNQWTITDLYISPEPNFADSSPSKL